MCIYGRVAVVHGGGPGQSIRVINARTVGTACSEMPWKARPKIPSPCMPEKSVPCSLSIARVASPNSIVGMRSPPTFTTSLE